MSKKELLLKVLADMASALLKDTTHIDTTAHIQELGFDSVSLVGFTDKVSSALNEEIHPGVFFEHTTLEKFADYLLAHKSESLERVLGEIASSSHGEQTLQDEGQNKSNGGDHSEVSDDVWLEFDAEFSSVDTVQETASSAETKADESTATKAVPVIVGGGIAGMLISHRLSMKNIPHIIVGNPEISDGPKLGESMTEVVSIEFAKNFKHLSEYFYPKAYTPFYMGNLVAGLSFNFFGSLSSIFLEEDAPKEFIHVDRLGFDQALYKEVAQAPECTWIEDRVEEIEYDKDADQISLLALSSGQTIRPSFVWDCTNHVRLLGRKIGIPYEDIDPRREVIFTHYYQKEGQNLCHAQDFPWMHATSLLRADGDFDGLTGVSWLIPLGSYVSVGISMLPEDVGDRTAEEVIALLTKAYARRGLDYSKYFPRRKEVIRVPSQHFMYDRFVGKNWALVGGSAASTWFTSGSNLSIVAFMASIADKIIDETEQYGRYYSDHIRGFAKTQKIYDTFMESNTGTVDAIKFLSGIVEQARSRISSFFMLGSETGENHAQVARDLWQEDVVVDKNYFDFLRQIAVHAQPESREQQTESVFQKFADLRASNQKIYLPYLRGSAIRQEKPELFQSV